MYIFLDFYFLYGTFLNVEILKKLGAKQFFNLLEIEANFYALKRSKFSKNIFFLYF